MKTYTKWILILGVTLLLPTVMFLRLSEAKRSESTASDSNKSPVNKVSLLAQERTTPRQAAPRVKRPQEIQSVASYQNDTSEPLRDMKPQPMRPKLLREGNPNPKIPHIHRDSPDPVVQDSITSRTLIQMQIPSPILNFDGIPFPGVACNCAPPDTDGEVGATQFVQIVNEGFQVFNKNTGASVLGPLGIQTIWTGFGGVCQNNGAGDPIALYDQLANRWLISQFAGTGVPTTECIAISTTSDATGAYHRYAFLLGTNFFDYPKLGVWPDGYYMAMNIFNASGTAFLGPQAFAFDRSQMLIGAPATFVTPGITGGSNEETFLPSDLDGTLLPPPGAPATFVFWPGGSSGDQYRVWHFHADFAVPGNTTFTPFASVPAAGFTARGADIPQLGTTSTLDAIGDRLMFRLQTRFFPDGHESSVANFTVDSAGIAAPRWFELRNVTSGPVTLHQEGTYQPDNIHRWMGSIAQDGQGNMAIGYSASSSTINPQIRYAGRLANGPLGILSQGEAHMFDGTGSQVGTGTRWGDYSAMSVDPVDNCTFWYTQEYYAVTSSFNWRTRIGTFNLCTAAPAPPLLQPAGVTLVNESCPPDNNGADPGERVTVNLAVRNIGETATTNLVGTLQPSANVLAPSGPENYGAIAPGATTSRNFAFTVDGTCGQSITLTLQLQDGTTNHGTVTYTMSIGALGPPATASYSSGDIAVPILDVATVEVPIVVPDTGVVSDINVRIRLNHTFDGDLVISLVHPDGTAVVLAGNRGGAGDNFGTGTNNCSGTPTVFDDSAANPISAGVAPFAGTFRPDQALSALNGKPSNGTWRLRVADVFALDVGTIGCVTLEITRQQFVCNTACAGAPRISTSATLSCSGPNTVANITISNSGTATATNVVLTAAMLGVVNGTPLPSTPPRTLTPGQSFVWTVTFSGAPSGLTTLKLGGTYTGGTFASSRRVNAPVCGTALFSPSNQSLTLPALLAALTSPTVLTGR